MTEIYSFRDNVWTETGPLPARMRSMRAATINNRVLLFGNARNPILEYDPETKEWTRIGTMMKTREGPGVAVVDYDDYKEFCQ